MSGPRSKPLPIASALRTDDPDASRQSREIAGLREEDRVQAERESVREQAGVQR